MKAIAYKIKELVTMPEVCRAYGLYLDNGFCKCVFHREKTPSMKIYKDGYKCFGCGANGSVIDFVMGHFGLSLYDACNKLNEDFALHLPIGGRGSLREYRAMQMAVRERERQIAIERAEKLRLQQQYDDALDFYACCDRDRLRFAPEREGESLHPMYVEACKHMAEASYLLDLASLELWQYEHER